MAMFRITVASGMSDVDPVFATWTSRNGVGMTG